ncbi:hypothetical protein SEA_JALEBI_89 [Gordonia phage Jalebi]|uniref:DNA-binding phage zinc finger domain-containing protein n=1 Tax=Gordonia phage Jalebi TaxID=2910757 RepID=A0AA49BN35_9CAUD|nr:hypothetical protein SEA_JALEBI_89 [Gordonia phage Jalebi]WNM69434.1 hypothetical protein SEA_SAMPUDON_91 [Gordonia phage Sampudon]
MDSRLEVRCPRCKAKPGDWCTGRFPKYGDHVHCARASLAVRMWNLATEAWDHKQSIAEGATNVAYHNAQFTKKMARLGKMRDGTGGTVQ